MYKWRTLIVDDEAKGRKSLRAMLNLLNAPIESIDEAASVEEAVLKIESSKPELVFLDIMLQKGTGFDVLEALQDRDFKLIFVTAYNDYALKAFRYAAVDYITKPIVPEELEEALNRLNPQDDSNLEDKLEALLANRKGLERLALHDAQGISLVRVKDILYCHAQNNYTEFHIANRKPILVSKTLKEYDDILKDEGFFRVHQSYLINLDQVSQFQKQDGGYVKMSDGNLIGVARRKKEELLKQLLGGRD